LHSSQITCLIGPNGSGKTTTLKAISGMLKTSSGSIASNGMHITNKPPHMIARMGILHIPQEIGVFPNLTVIENLSLATFGFKHKLGSQIITERIIERFPILTGKLTRVAGTLSGGEQKALSLARAVLLPHKILLLDEPTIGLSPTLRRNFYELLMQLAREGSAILIVEQRVMDALGIADYSYVLIDGAIVASGTPNEVKADKVLSRFLPL